ncbi:hypothetical protein [Chryseobacterium indoltheticum]|uniref:Uncharacterized protein n=1 Tax=Chryseobacterium indoltheticum TaxID=254 RepID=A0A381F4N6_9FLAO|nr:hypothetical protein [Chryseobacterium indoltheticum]AZA74969.1 hypothetical protein EG358_14875 [Chryseobacterium indoltheticum]SIQ60588.1 hypothetical protein SAMN05421682_106219 [Chryseobacterium indoltheticum]SUX41424.1 Uncharacterised protein [Chryseobacterium indoltheticum]
MLVLKFNGKINAKWLKQFSSKFEHLKDGVHASHPQYTERLFNYIENVGIYKYLDDIGKTNIDDLTKLELELSKSQMTNQQIVHSFINFANYTDEFFEASFRYIQMIWDKV